MEKIIFLIIFASLLLQNCNKKDIHKSEIISVFDSVQMDEKWQSVKYDDGEQIYFPITWKPINHSNYTLYLKAGAEIYFYLDIMQTDNKNFDHVLINSTKGLIIKENKISKF